MFSRYTFWGGRRRGGRRLGETEDVFVDRYGLRLMVIVMAIILLNLADAWFTLYFLSHGGQELNPIVQGILDLSIHPWPFLIFKTIGIGFACAFLALTKNFRCARWGMCVVFGGYLLLLLWHLYLLNQLH